MYIIDTHALLWYLYNSSEISEKARQIIDNEVSAMPPQTPQTILFSLDLYNLLFIFLFLRKNQQVIGIRSRKLRMQSVSINAVKMRYSA